MIIAIANQKGGVGKTTTAINLAAAIAQRGHRTVLVDVDPQANATLSYLMPDDIGGSTYDLLVDEAVALGDIVRPCKVPSLMVAPAKLSLAKVEPRLAGQLDSHFRLKDKLEAGGELFDFAVIDTPPTLGMLTVNAMVAAS